MPRHSGAAMFPQDHPEGIEVPHVAEPPPSTVASVMPSGSHRWGPQGCEALIEIQGACCRIFDGSNLVWMRQTQERGYQKLNIFVISVKKSHCCHKLSCSGCN